MDHANTKLNQKSTVRLIRKITNILLTILTIFIFVALFYTTFTTDASTESNIIVKSFPEIWRYIGSFDAESLLKSFYFTAFIMSMIFGVIGLIIKNRYSEQAYNDLKNKLIILEIFLGMLYTLPISIILFKKSAQETALFYFYGFIAIFIIALYSSLILLRWYGEYSIQKSGHKSKT